MTSRDFCFWLQGYLELAPLARDAQRPALAPEQLECVRSHLALVFKHEIDPSMGPAKHQASLDSLHGDSLHGPPLMRC